MKIYEIYEPGYRKQQVTVAAETLTLVNEAIAARLKNGEIEAEEMPLYCKIMQDAEHSLNYAKECFVKEMTEKSEAAMESGEEADNDES